jgi:hypothetical protein
MTITAVAPLYASEAFVVESLPEQNGAQITRVGNDNARGQISSVVFVDIEAALFLTDFATALSTLSDAEVDTQYLDQYSPLMRTHYLH